MWQREKSKNAKPKSTADSIESEEFDEVDEYHETESDELTLESYKGK